MIDLAQYRARAASRDGILIRFTADEWLNRNVRGGSLHSRAPGGKLVDASERFLGRTNQPPPAA